MTTEVKITIKTDKLIHKTTSIYTESSSALYLPKTWIGETICVIPVNYKVKIDTSNEEYNITVKSGEIYQKKVKLNGKNNLVYLPVHLAKVDVIAFPVPEVDYDIL